MAHSTGDLFDAAVDAFNKGELKKPEDLIHTYAVLSHLTSATCAIGHHDVLKFCELARDRQLTFTRDVPEGNEKVWSNSVYGTGTYREKGENPIPFAYFFSVAGNSLRLMHLVGRRSDVAELTRTG
jgi:hypothetical protein